MCCNVCWALCTLMWGVTATCTLRLGVLSLSVSVILSLAAPTDKFEIFGSSNIFSHSHWLCSHLFMLWALEHSFIHFIYYTVSIWFPICRWLCILFSLLLLLLLLPLSLIFCSCILQCILHVNLSSNWILFFSKQSNHVYPPLCAEPYAACQICLLPVLNLSPLNRCRSINVLFSFAIVVVFNFVYLFHLQLATSPA